MDVKNVNKNNFEQEVLEADSVVLVDFWAPWCGPCKMIGPIVEEVAKECDQLKVAKVNVDEALGVAQQYGIVSIPTLLVFKDGEVVNRSVGLISKAEILELVKA